MTGLTGTYRLQLGPDLDFEAARHRVAYLRALGVSHLYLSPVMQARAGSTHGYDVVDPTRVSTALGGEPGLRALAGAGLPLVVDIVPNHMAACDEYPFWRDPELRARFFDLDPDGGHRRFFDIDMLAGVRMEDPEVFDVTHRKLLELVHDGVVAAVRVDHVDGLADPAGYLHRLKAAGVPQVWVEKILEPGEALPPWPVTGTTGYEFASDATALFVNPAGHDALDALAAHEEDFAAMATVAKAEQVATTFQPELRRLRGIADVPELERGLSMLPVYRTYLDPHTRSISAQDRSALDRLPGDLVDALVGQNRVPDEFVVRFQQTTGAVMAKGIEDTAMYRHVRLLALNEVGGDPDRFGLAVDGFHAANERRLRAWPETLLTATTHDTKRGADTRARIGALAEFASEWCELVGEWRAMVDDLRSGGAPDPVEELFVFQTLLGAWPISDARLSDYLVKALREAKRNTSWVSPDETWERAVVDTAIALSGDPRFLRSFLPFWEQVRLAGERNSLGEVVLRIASPGVPDVYQGDELWNHVLVDPDNRRPVDWDARTVTLDDLIGGRAPDRSSAKLFTVATLLGLRGRVGDFASLPYRPIPAGPSVCAFARGDDVVVVVPLRVGAAPAAVHPEAPGDDRWTDLLAPLGDVYGDRRPRVYERAAG
ncbi:MAG: (1-_4)-alpha-D-glucan 1-alpha-D-glucosylmutase [Actinomycetota bacterium]|nr:(1->4)-alpha-D-glucan 1-alpha-D-glucosylmutase [Actinomycetota bacterium]